MLTKQDTDHWLDWAQRAYRPLPREEREAHPAHDPRAAHAGEYAAFRRGEINRKLDILIVLLGPRAEQR